MAGKRRGGILSLTINGVRYDAKGSFTYNRGTPKRESIVGADRVHGFKEMPQPAFIEGVITDAGDLDLAALTSVVDAVISLELANGKVFVLNDGWFAGEGTVSTEEGEIQVRFEGTTADEG